VELDRLLGEPELLADLLVREPARDALEDVPFLRRQLGLCARRVGRLVAAERPEDIPAGKMLPELARRAINAYSRGQPSLLRPARPACGLRQTS